MRRQCWLVAILLCASLTCGVTPALAQRASRDQIDANVDARLKKQWEAFLAEAARELGLTLKDGRLSGTREVKVNAYAKVLDRLEDDDDLLALFTPAYIQSLIDERVESRMPTSVNATSTNPATAGLPERSGSTSLVALAADLSSLVSADKTAISITLNALAFVSLSDPELFSELANYQRHDFARRFSGTVVFGAKIPEKEITGLSNLPDFDKLLDVFSWDVKVRVWGDKDPRSARWSSLTVRAGGLLTQKAAVLLSLVGTSPQAGESLDQTLEDAQIVQGLLTQRVGRGVSEIKARIARSPQLSVKAAGTHLTKEPGKNKYSFSALFDVGVGPADITANAQYAKTDDIRLGVEQLFATKVWTLSAEVTSHLAPGSIVQGRTIDWSLGASASIFQDAASLPIVAENTWKIFTRFELPVRGGGKIPVSVIYSNDPNAISKERYVSGQIGVSYDFAALKQLFAPGS